MKVKRTRNHPDNQDMIIFKHIMTLDCYFSTFGQGDGTELLCHIMIIVIYLIFLKLPMFIRRAKQDKK